MNICNIILHTMEWNTFGQYENVWLCEKYSKHHCQYYFKRVFYFNICVRNLNILDIQSFIKNDVISVRYHYIIITQKLIIRKMWFLSIFCTSMVLYFYSIYVCNNICITSIHIFHTHKYIHHCLTIYESKISDTVLKNSGKHWDRPGISDNLISKMYF